MTRAVGLTILAIILLALALTFCARPAPAHDALAWSDPERDAWFRSLKMPGSNASCCDLRDCEAADARQEADGSWSARINDIWLSTAPPISALRRTAERCSASFRRSQGSKTSGRKGIRTGSVGASQDASSALPAPDANRARRPAARGGGLFAFAIRAATIPAMADARLPLTIKALPGGGFAIHFANGKRAIIIYGRDPRVAQASGDFTTEEAKGLAQEVARALTTAWGG